MFGKLKITCEEAHEICNKSQYNEASFTEKFKLSLHLLICKFCSLYVKQNSAITKICQSKANDEKNVTSKMSEKNKKLLQEKIEQLNSR